jgi:hypothetical protein
MMSAKDREVAESAFKKYEHGGAEINEAVRQEHTKHEAAVKNMHCLRLLRLEREAKKSPR